MRQYKTLEALFNYGNVITQLGHSHWPYDFRDTFIKTMFEPRRLNGGLSLNDKLLDTRTHLVFRMSQGVVVNAPDFEL